MKPPIKDSLEAMARGQVKWFNAKKGYGFIIDPNVEDDIFVHFSEIKMDGFRTLDEGVPVEYELYRDEKGYKARNVHALEASPRPNAPGTASPDPNGEKAEDPDLQHAEDDSSAQRHDGAAAHS